MPAHRKISARQTEILIGFLEANKNLAKGHVSQQGGPLGKQNNSQIWERLTEKLNCCGSGSTKSAKEWKVYWNNIKYKVRAKATKIRRHMTGTGGGPAFEGGHLTTEESRIMAILGNESIFGEKSVRIPFPEFENMPPAVRSSQEVSNYENSAGSAFVIGEEEIINTDEHLTPLPEDRVLQSAVFSPMVSLQVPAPATPVTATPVTTTPITTDSTTTTPAPAVLTPQVTSSRPYVRRIPDIPTWACEMEERHIVAQERTAAALEELLDVQKKILNVLNARLPI
ncbi:unnamed protein product [Diatraea saccharalis]|uniref:Regulatory protein zeste n=1 Tax=Diatraea saccharalis TaxID=40085 RepID=A0A9N9WDG1_9NEOP|nr:unnamed protein product [Diatraea saccharalis]